MFTQLLVKHFEKCVPITARLPVPPSLQQVCAAILILHKVGYPRHFLNGYYVILRPLELSDPAMSNSEEYDYEWNSGSPVSLDSRVVSLIQCADTRWKSLLNSMPFFSHHFPLTIPLRILGCPSDTANLPGLVSKSASWTLSLKPSFIQKCRMSLQCYATQLSTNSSIVDGNTYFCRQYPAKECLVAYETTLAWKCGGIGPVGFIQYISLQEDPAVAPDILITGLSIEALHQRRGFARGLISALVNCVWPCNEIWVEVEEENVAAFSLYLQCGFEKRNQQWSMTVRNRFDAL